MEKPRIIRAVSVIMFGGCVVACDAYRRGLSPALAAGTGLFIATASTGLLVLIFIIRWVGRSTRRDT